MTVPQINGVLFFILGLFLTVLLCIAYKELVLDYYASAPIAAELIIVCSALMPFIKAVGRMTSVFQHREELWWPITKNKRFSFLSQIDKGRIYKWVVFYLGGIISLLLIYYGATFFPNFFEPENKFIQYVIIFLEVTPFIAGVFYGRGSV
jgi:hypothetical protein